MGQKLGKAKLVNAAHPITNLSRKAVAQLWQVFNDIADGFGITKNELEEICIDLKDELNISRVTITEKASVLFDVLDTDTNGLIDALEFFGCMAAISGMRLKEIFEFILDCYDFDGTLCLCIDEVTLALKSTAHGLCKLCSDMPPREEVIEQLVSKAFCDITGSETVVIGAISVNITEIVENLLCHPDVWSWFSYFSSPDQVNIKKYELLQSDVDYEKENVKITASASEALANEWNVRCSADKLSTKIGVVESEQAKEAKRAVRGAQVQKPTEPWLSATTMLTPIQYSNAQLRKSAPDTSLDIAWIYGYQAEKLRNNLRYSYKGSTIIYTVGKYAVIYDFDDHSQSIFSGHSNDILSLAIHPAGRYVATGEVGSPLASVCVWDCDSKEIMFTDMNFHQEGVIHVVFSLNNGHLLGAIGNDMYHSLAVYKWQENQILFTTRTNTGNCLSCSFLNDGTIAVGGDCYMLFWSEVAEGYACRRGNFSNHTTIQPITCIAAISTTSSSGVIGALDTCVTGTASGALFLWTDRNCVKVIKGHSGAVSSIYACSHAILTGGKDKRIRIWTNKLEPGANFSLASFGSNPSIRSVCMSNDGTTILFGTRAAEIYEISAIDGSDVRGGPVTSGHSYGSVRSLAAHPSKHEFVTVGDDCRLRVWDMNNHVLLNDIAFEAQGTTVCYSPNGDQIVVGLGGDRTTYVKSGAFVVLNEEDLSILHEARDSGTPIQTVSFSPEGETLAVAADDGPIYLYGVQEEFELVGRCVRHAEPNTHIDFSVDGEWIRSNTMQGNDISFFNSDDASLQSNLPAMRDVIWGSHTCIYSWHMKAVHQSTYDGEKVLSVHTPVVDPDGTGSIPCNFVACGTSYGYVRLHSFPCVSEDSECHRFPAHAGPVSCVRLSFDSQRLISMGLTDRCAIQWDVFTEPSPVGDALQQAVSVDYPESEDYALEARGGSDLEEDFMTEHNTAVHGVIFDMPDTLNSNPAVDSWLTDVVEPTNDLAQSTSIPDASLRLEHVYGYRCQDMRNNIRYVGTTGEIVYVCATVGVMLSVSSKAQRFFQGHTDAITAFTTSEDGLIVATGQMGAHPKVFVWSSTTGQPLGCIPDAQMSSVTCLAFSKDSMLLAVVGLDDNHTISIYNWRHRFLIGRVYGGECHILSVSFSPNGKYITTCGVKHVAFWSITGRSIKKKKGVLGEVGKLQPFLCCVYFNELSTVGTADGNCYVFDNSGSLQQTVKAHDGAVSAMNVSRCGSQLVTGGKDGAVRIWSQTFECIKEIFVDNTINSACSRVRSVALSDDLTKVLIGTRGCEIFEVLVQDGTAVTNKPLVCGHGTRELWGLASHPLRDEFVTCGDDATLRVWDSKNRVLIKTMRMDAPARAIVYSPDGKYVCIGFGSSRQTKKGKIAAAKEGAFTVLLAGEWKVVHEGRDSEDQIRVVKFSPDSSSLAIGSEDSHVYVYNIKDHYSRKCTITCHKAPILSVDFSLEGTYIMSVDTSKKVCYCDASSGVLIPAPAALRDEKWATWSSPVGWPVMGLWLCQPKHTEPIAVQKSWNGQLMCGGNTAGRLFVIHNPCPTKAGFVDNFAHAGPIAQVQWSAGDSMLLSIGKRDHCIMQWKVMYDAIRESGDEGGISCEDSEVQRDGGHEFRADLVVGSSGRYSQSPPWQSNITSPSGHSASHALEMNTSWNRPDPVVTVGLDHISGVKIGDARQTLKYNEDGHGVYIIGTFGVINNREDAEHPQVIYQGHKHSLISLDVDVSGKLACTGEFHPNPEVHVWNACTGTNLAVFKNIHRRGVTSVAFSTKNDTIASLGQDPRHSLVILKSPSRTWTDGFVMCSVGVSSKKMLWVMTFQENEFPFVVGGDHCLYFFRPAGKSMERSRGIFGRRRKIQPMMCAVRGNPITQTAHPKLSSNALESTHTTTTNTSLELGDAPQSLMITGCVSGHLYTWHGNKVIKQISAHDGCINAIVKLSHRGYITGGKEGLVKIWSSDLKLLHTYNVQSFTPRPFDFSCHALAINRHHTKITVGMRGGETYELTLATHSKALLMEGHSERELHGLAANPVNGDEYATCGDDGVVRIWSLRQRICLRKVWLEVACRAVCYSPDGLKLAVGIGGNPLTATKDGAFMVLDAATLAIEHEDRKAKKWISDVKYSPNGNYLAVASQDGRVFLHDANELYKQLYVIELPTKDASVSRIDFSKDSSKLRLSCSSEELLNYDVIDGSAIPLASAVKDTEWNTHSVAYSWPLQGVWGPAGESNGVIASDVLQLSSSLATSSSGTTTMALTAVSYQNGDTRIYPFPCTQPGDEYINLPGVGTQSKCVAFSSDGYYLLVLDSFTRSVIQYRINFNSELLLQQSHEKRLAAQASGVVSTRQHKNKK